MKVYIVDAKRTAVGKFLGGLAAVNPVDLTVPVVEAVLQNQNLAAEKIDQLVLGNVLAAGHGQNIARQVSLKAGLPDTKIAYLVNILCGSGLKTVEQAYNEIRLGEAEAILTGGVESMSQAAQILPNFKSRAGLGLGDARITDTLLLDGLTDGLGGYHMGITAENIADKYQISREEQDKFAYASQQKALAAIEAGVFETEIVPVSYKARKKKITISVDEHPNAASTPEKLAHLRPAFKEGGTVTAGNASGINDGASVLLVASEKFVEENGLKPLVEIVGFGLAGVDPAVMGLGPAPAIQKLLEKTGVGLSDIDLFELNEAFAAQSIGVLKELAATFDVSYDSLAEKTNLLGGAIALGHPLGASGARVATTLVHQMARQKEKKYGIAALCIGGGMGIAMLVKNV
ncbi:acetyl-CoA acetyltransferase [Listeria floridensis FSL S10-1187]|uniref:acetyl-CoA C-acetyltransferase n=1 Tax=Listeria floridensis FSL S10-1187 TaxID=1265817 RepID=A0ABP3B3Q3_9LIST|nr:thiolase family protein [Listeria floridensis]EUJ33717.1 acetyl-CoA acetyltransferase [Listeria floridensis FSL S10-1187]